MILLYPDEIQSAFSWEAWYLTAVANAYFCIEISYFRVVSFNNASDGYELR